MEGEPKNINISELSDAEKLKQATAEHGLEVSEEEKKRFDEWRRSAPVSSLEKPIFVESVNDILETLPDVPNYLNERVGLYFKKEKFTDDELWQILENFTANDPRFEISVTRYEDDVVAVDVGDKGRVKGEPMKGEWFGHCHPLFKLRNSEELPRAFVDSLMPSRGDIEEFFANPKRVEKGTRIVSKKGMAMLRLIVKHPELNPNSPVFSDYAKQYFDQFLGENKFGFHSDKELAAYLMENFGLEIIFSDRIPV